MGNVTTNALIESLHAIGCRLLYLQSQPFGFSFNGFSGGGQGGGGLLPGKRRTSSRQGGMSQGKGAG